MSAAPPRAVAWLAAACALAGCKVDTPGFHQKIFGCNPNAADPACGTDAQNQPMACVPAYQLGGRNFCATGCFPNPTAPEGQDAICLPSGPKDSGLLAGARLPRCKPSAGNDCGREELSCLRTDLQADEGVCMTVNSCQADSDCRDPVRSKCMGALLRENYNDPRAQAALKPDHTYCLQFGCRARRTACSPGETCLRDVLAQSSNPSDICVPNCDANHNCPPNYFCFQDLYSKASAPVCIPGLLGLRCRSRLDCLFGDCVPTRDLGDAPDPATCREANAPEVPGEIKPGCDLGFSVCTVRCDIDDDCSRFDSEYGTLYCSKRADGVGHCTGARAFRGASCVPAPQNPNGDCIFPGEVCAHAGPDLRGGSCLQPCQPFAQCPSYGGVPHVCRPPYGPNGIDLSASTWLCWPGYFGMPCSRDSHCLAGLQCLNQNPMVSLDKACTLPCEADVDCGANRFTTGGWCHPMLKICKPPLTDDSPGCDRDLQCESKKCIVFGTGRKCDKTPGY